MKALLAAIALAFVPTLIQALNLAPVFSANMNQHTLKENTPVRSIVYTLAGQDPEGSRVRFGLSGTDLLTVDPVTGSVRVNQAIDRESRGVNDNEVRLVVTIQDEPEEGAPPNVVRVPITVIILDENDNAPVFQGTPYKASVAEDTPVGSTLFQALEVTDADLVGDVLDVQCVHRDGYDIGVCDSFDIQPRRLETDHDMFRGSVILKQPLDYRYTFKDNQQ
jgi:hypothetical protein